MTGFGLKRGTGFKVWAASPAKSFSGYAKENAALFLQLGLPSVQIIHHENLSKKSMTGLFENSLRFGGIWQCRLFVLVWTEAILKTVLFENNDVIINV